MPVSDQKKEKRDIGSCSSHSKLLIDLRITAERKGKNLMQNKKYIPILLKQATPPSLQAFFIP